MYNNTLIAFQMETYNRQSRTSPETVPSNINQLHKKGKTPLTWLFRSTLAGVLVTALCVTSLCLGGALSWAFNMGDAGEAGGISGLSAMTVRADEEVGAGAIAIAWGFRLTFFRDVVVVCCVGPEVGCKLMTNGCALNFMPS